MGDSSDGEVFRVEHGDLRLAFLPGVGGRLLSLRLGEREVLWQNPSLIGPSLDLLTATADLPPETGMASWWNFGGSKTWPAPQYDGEGLQGWNGPPDPILDGGPYELAVTRDSGTTTVIMTSQPDPRSGLQITRRFMIDIARPGGFEEHITLRNISERTVRWSPWEVCQVATTRTDEPGTIMVTGSGAFDVLQVSQFAGTPISEPGLESVAIPVQRVVAKWGFCPPANTITFSDAEISLSLAFTVEAGATYPEGGCCAELWMQYPTDAPIAAMEGWQPDAALVELEVLGPVRALAPGEQTSLMINWVLSRA
jgi:hypothetical protein